MSLLPFLTSTITFRPTQEAPLGKAHKLPMRLEPELLPNLLLLLLALVDGQSKEQVLVRVDSHPGRAGRCETVVKPS